MHFLGPGIAHHLHNLHRGGAAHDAVIDQDDALALNEMPVGIVFSFTPRRRILSVG